MRTRTNNQWFYSSYIYVRFTCVAVSRVPEGLELDSGQRGWQLKKKSGGRCLIKRVSKWSSRVSTRQGHSQRCAGPIRGGEFGVRMGEQFPGPWPLSRSCISSLMWLWGCRRQQHVFPKFASGVELRYSDHSSATARRRPPALCGSNRDVGEENA